MDFRKVVGEVVSDFEEEILEREGTTRAALIEKKNLTPKITTKTINYLAPKEQPKQEAFHRWIDVFCQVFDVTPQSIYREAARRIYRDLTPQLHEQPLEAERDSRATIDLMARLEHQIQKCSPEKIEDLELLRDAILQQDRARRYLLRAFLALLGHDKI